MVAVGIIVWLASELMFFAALFAAYFTIRNVTNAQAAAAGTETLWQTSTEMLNIPFAIVNTTVLVASSFTCQMGVFAAERGQVKRTGSLAAIRSWGLREWYILTFLMGAFFIGGQVVRVRRAVLRGRRPSPPTCTGRRSSWPPASTDCT